MITFAPLPEFSGGELVDSSTTELNVGSGELSCGGLWEVLDDTGSLLAGSSDKFVDELSAMGAEVLTETSGEESLLELMDSPMIGCNGN